MSIRLIFFIYFVFVGLSRAQEKKNWPLPEPQDKLNLGVNIQRTMQHLYNFNSKRIYFQMELYTSWNG